MPAFAALPAADYAQFPPLKSKKIMLTNSRHDGFTVCTTHISLTVDFA